MRNCFLQQTPLEADPKAFLGKLDVGGLGPHPYRRSVAQPGDFF